MPARAGAQWIPGDLGIHMGVAVDEARRDDQSIRIDGASGHRLDAADLDDLAIGDAHVGREAGLARAIDDRAATDHQIEGHQRRSFCSTIFQ